MNYVTIKIIRIGQPSIEVSIDKGDTVKKALEAAAIEVTNAEFRFNGVVVTATTKLNANGDLLISKQIAGA